MTTTPDTWSLVETAFDVRNNRHYESLLAIGSGPLQQRAALEEGLRDDPQDVDYLRVIGDITADESPRFKSRVGTYLPGVSGPHPTCRDQMINLPAIHGLIIFAAGERLDLEHGRISNYIRRLDLRTGRLTRSFVWQTQAGAAVRVCFERFISAQRRHVMALRCSVEHVDGPPAELRFIGALDAEVRTNGFDHFTSIDITGEHEPITLAVRTNSGIDVAAAALVTCDRSVLWNVDLEARWVGLSGTCILDPGQTVRVSKFAAMTSSHHVAGSPLDAARNLAWEAATTGFDRLAAESDAVWRERWDKTDVVIEGDPAGQLALRVSLYHMLRAVVEDDPRCAIDAEAAAGEAYCGRYFWDTEIFMLPLFLYTRPEVGLTLARFRVATLDGARRNAERSGYPGARYAWESSPSGDENCPNRHCADHEVHVTADVAYGLWHAHLANPDDLRFLQDVTEVLIETARYWCRRVSYTSTRDQYELLMVMGPDEYTPFSRNNAYTNRLVAFALSLASFAWQKLERLDADAVAVASGLRAGRCAELGDKLQLADGELARFADVAGKLRLPYDESRRLVLQSDDFFDQEPLDFERCWPDRARRLEACVAQERLYRSRVLKQADVVQLMALFPHEFDAEQMRVAYETYEPLTSHDSSLSRPMHAVVAARIGKHDEALRLWRQSVGLDLAVASGPRSGRSDVADGIHAACAGANWQAAILGFAGLRTRMQSEILHLDPHLPASWTALRFPLVWDGQPLFISIEGSRVTIEHRGRKPLDAHICGQRCTLKPSQSCSVRPPCRPKL
ncbi:MAG: glycoside hydrolase family 65 protein [Phycisphaerae bacterium]|nr:glycoside hydrolase family 65 protein [Phycisphaerae bacterium]